MQHIIKRLQILKLQANITVAFDIGAYRGDFTRALKTVWTDCKVWQFEADDRQKEFLSNPFIGLLGDVPGKVIDFYTLPDNQVTTGSSIFKENSQYYLTPVVLQKIMTTIDEAAKFNEYSGDWKNSGLVKIDTQGSELLILKGAKKFIETNKPRFFLLECSIIEHNKNGPKIHEIFQYMDSIGYQMKDIFDVLHSTAGLLLQTDILFERK